MVKGNFSWGKHTSQNEVLALLYCNITNLFLSDNSIY